MMFLSLFSNSYMFINLQILTSASKDKIRYLVVISVSNSAPTL